MIPKFESGKTECCQCKGKISGEGVTGFLSVYGDYYCLKCAENNPSLLSTMTRDVRISGKWDREHLNAAFWSRNSGRAPCMKHFDRLNGEGSPSQLYVLNGVPICAFCMFKFYPDIYNSFLVRLERKYEAANV